MLNDENEPKDIYYAMNRFVFGMTSKTTKKKQKKIVKQMDIRRKMKENFCRFGIINEYGLKILLCVKIFRFASVSFDNIH